MCEERSGGGASAGVGGGGADGGSRAIELRLRGISLGSFALRSGGGDDIDGVVAGIMCVCCVVESWKLRSSRCLELEMSQIPKSVPIVPSTNVRDATRHAWSTCHTMYLKTNIGLVSLDCDGKVWRWSKSTSFVMGYITVDQEYRCPRFWVPSRLAMSIPLPPFS